MESKSDHDLHPNISETQSRDADSSRDRSQKRSASKTNGSQNLLNLDQEPRSSLLENANLLSRPFEIPRDSDADADVEATPVASAAFGNVVISLEPAIPIRRHSSPQDMRQQRLRLAVQTDKPYTKTFGETGIPSPRGPVGPPGKTGTVVRTEGPEIEDIPETVEEELLKRFYTRVEKEKELTKINGAKLGFVGDTNAPTLDDYFDYCFEFRSHPLDFMEPHLESSDGSIPISDLLPSEYVKQASSTITGYSEVRVPRMSANNSLEVNWKTSPRVALSVPRPPPELGSSNLADLSEDPKSVKHQQADRKTTDKQLVSPSHSININTPNVSPSRRVMSPEQSDAREGIYVSPGQPLVMKMEDADDIDDKQSGPPPDIYKDVEGLYVVCRDVRDYFARICTYRDIDSIERAGGIPEQPGEIGGNGTYFSSYSFAIHHSPDPNSSIFRETLLGKAFSKFKKLGARKERERLPETESLLGNVEMSRSRSMSPSMPPPKKPRTETQSPSSPAETSYPSFIKGASQKEDPVAPKKKFRRRVKPKIETNPSPPIALLLGGFKTASAELRAARILSAGAGSIPPFYGLHDFMEALKEFEDEMQIDLLDFMLLVRELFIWCLRKFGCDILEEISSEKSKVFVKVRMKEVATRRLANHLDYICQMNRNATSYQFLIENDDYIPPYLPYDEHAENMRDGYNAARMNSSLVWSRFDGLNRPFLNPLHRNVSRDPSPVVRTDVQSEHLDAVSQKRQATLGDAYRYPINDALYGTLKPDSLDSSSKIESSLFNVPKTKTREFAHLQEYEGRRTGRKTVVDDLYKSARFLSIFRDVDRIRLLTYVVAFHFNIAVMSSSFHFVPSDSVALKEGYRHAHAMPSVLLSHFPIHKRPILMYLRKEWANIYRGPCQSNDPIDEIRNYFGEELAFYFLWTRFFTDSLTWPVTLGTFVYILEWIVDPKSRYDSNTTRIATLVFALYMVVWSSAFATNWSKEERFWRLKWGMESERLSTKVESPDFIFDYYVVDSLNPKRFAKYYNPHKTKLRVAVASAVCMTAITAVISAVVGIFAFRIIIDKRQEYFWWAKGYEATVISSLQACQIILFDYLWCNLVAWVTKFENHKYEKDRRSSFILKMFIFRFTNNFYALLYIGFAKTYLDPCIPTPENGIPDRRGCLPYLRLQIGVLYMFYGLFNIIEIALPLLAFYLRDRSKGKKAKTIERQSYLAPYDSSTLIEDHLEIVIQFVAVVMFSVVMPCVPLFAWILNHNELRVDAFKIVVAHQRTYPAVAPNGLGIYNDLVALVGLLALPANVAFCLFTIPFFDKDLSPAIKLLAFIVFEHVLILLRIYVSVNRPQENEKTESARERMHLAVHDIVWGGSQFMEFEPANTNYGLGETLVVKDAPQKSSSPQVPAKDKFKT